MGLPGWFANLIDLAMREQGPSTAHNSDMALQPPIELPASDAMSKSDDPYAWMDSDDFTTIPVLPDVTFDEPSIIVNGFPAGSQAYERLLAFKVQRSGFTPSIADLTEEAPTATVSHEPNFTFELWGSSAVASLSSIYNIVYTRN
jgi:hypothetical protein